VAVQLASSGKTTEELGSGGLSKSYWVAVEAMVVVEVTSATAAAVTVDAETLMHTQALLYCSASEHRALRYAGTVLSSPGAVTVSPRFFTDVVGTAASVEVAAAGSSVVTVTVTASSYTVTHDVLAVPSSAVSKRVWLGVWQHPRGRGSDGDGEKGATVGKAAGTVGPRRRKSNSTTASVEASLVARGG
jgi:hypothetical protein